MRRDRFAVIGLGHFGAYAMRTLYAAGKEVIAVDMDSEAVREAAEYSHSAIVADATDRDAMAAIGMNEVDAAVVSLGERMDIIILAALNLRDLEVPHIAVKALSEEHGRILKAIGVHEIIHPEKDAATRLARRLARQDVIDMLPLLPGYSIAEIKAPREFVGKSLRDLALRNHLRVQLVAIQSGEDPNQLNIVPRAEDVIAEGDVLVLLGLDEDLDRVREVVYDRRRRDVT